MIETKNKDIRGNDFAVTQLGFKKSREVFARLTSIFGPALGALAGDAVSAVKSGSGVESGVESGLGAALEALCGRVTEKDLEYLCDTFSITTTVKLAEGGQRTPLNADTQEIVFGGHLEDCFAWLAFCLEVNYRGFFDVLMAALPVKAARAAA